MHFKLFGYFGYLWLFALAYALSLPKPKINQIFFEKLLGIVIICLSLLILQGLFIKDSGIFSRAFSSILVPIITPAGVFLLTLCLLVFGVSLLVGQNVKDLLVHFIGDLQKEFKEMFGSKSQKQAVQSVPKQANKSFEYKDFLNKIKDFFTPLSKEEISKEPRPLTLEELIEQSPKESNVSKQEIKEIQEENLEDNNKQQQDILKEGFNPSIDEERHGVELPTYETFLSEKDEKKEEEIEIKIVHARDAKPNLQNGFVQINPEQVLEKLQKIDNLLHKEEKESDPVRIVPKPIKEEIVKNEFEEVAIQEEILPKKEFKPIKSYPKNLYAAKPFSALELEAKENDKQEEIPNTIFYYDKPPKEDLQKASIQEVETQEALEDDLKDIQNALSEELQEAQKALDYRSQESELSQIKEAIKPQILKAQQDLEEREQTFEEDESTFIEVQNSDNDLKDIQNALSEELQEAQKALDYRSQESELSQIKEAIKPQILKAQQDLEEREQTFEEDESTFIEVSYTPPKQNTMPFYNYANFQETTQNLKEIMPNMPLVMPETPNLSNTLQETKKEEIKEQPNNDLNTQENFGKEELKTFEVSQEITYLQEQPTQEKQSQESRSLNTEQPAQKQVFQGYKENQKSNLQQDFSVQNASTQENLQNPMQEFRVEKPKMLEENQALLEELTLNDESVELDNKDFILPPLDFLQTPSEERAEVDESEIDRKINDLLGKLRMFKIEGDIVRTYSGPIVTTFEFRPSPNVKVSRILTLQDDLAMALRAKTIRIQAPVPGKDVVGIEIPNQHIETIYLREILENDLFKNSASPLTLALGKDIVGNPFVTDLKKLPHLLIAGTTGSGKSVGINAMILSLLYKNSPDMLKLIMIDPKMLEFSIYNDIPHLLTPVITQAKKAIIALDSTVKEMERRYSLMSEARTKNIEGYNQKALNEGFEPFPYIVVIIDELADLMMTGGKEAEVSISRLAQMARASGIHLIVATQRPSVDVVTGLIKANLPSRISYKVGQKIDSKVILDTFGAESLLGRGDMLFTPPGGGIVRLHAPWSSEEEIEEIVEFIKSQRAPEYDETFMPSEDEALGLSYEGEVDELYEEAKRIMLNEGKTSISYLQRRLNIGYNKAANIVEQMQAKGFLSAPNSKGVREILNA
ncbi:DNA translocase FtsK [Helicobacter valdiviensis]